jgi:hypothetical protein
MIDRINRLQLITDEFDKHVGEILNIKGLIKTLGLPENTVRNCINIYLSHRLEPEEGHERMILPSDGESSPLSSIQTRTLSNNNDRLNIKTGAISQPHRRQNLEEIENDTGRY